ncbi:hypothetical protein ROZALSC1DRAFT_27430 [Rozella allomycis CSF55]|uniref:Uncharacterized protein n=1 Tax=Rozella allomycis (strain CSF55) TaxID=988480 RepID=A0A4P9YNG4_ROZAC|nr:hypothetical protein ROZALSC1DRAFT_27430 [Rozella allomycis CSF55]
MFLGFLNATFVYLDSLLSSSFELCKDEIIDVIYFNDYVYGISIHGYLYRTHWRNHANRIITEDPTTIDKVPIRRKGISAALFYDAKLIVGFDGKIEIFAIEDPEEAIDEIIDSRISHIKDLSVKKGVVWVVTKLKTEKECPGAIKVLNNQTVVSIVCEGNIILYSAMNGQTGKDIEYYALNGNLLHSYKCDDSINNFCVNSNGSRILFTIAGNENIYMYKPSRVIQLSIKSKVESCYFFGELIGLKEKNNLEIYSCEEENVDPATNGECFKVCQVNLKSSSNSLIDIYKGAKIAILCDNKIEFEELILPEKKVDQIIPLFYLNRCQEMMKMGEKMKERKFFSKLNSIAEYFLFRFRILHAKYFYGLAGNMANAMALELLFNPNKAYIRGFIYYLMADYSRAQSDTPKQALQMRIELKNWEQALVLAQRLDEIQIPKILINYSLELEREEQFTDSYKMCLEALSIPSLGDTDRIEATKCLIRLSFRMGNITKGNELMNTVNPEKSFVLDCAVLLNQICQFGEAAKYFESANDLESAAECYLKAKSLIRHVKSTKALIDYGKAMLGKIGKFFGIECDDFEEAIKAFEIVKDYDKAKEIVRRTKSKNGAKMLANYFFEKSDLKSVVEFYLTAGLTRDAFEIAQTQGLVVFYASLIEDPSIEELNDLAIYFMNKRDYYNAGVFFFKAKDYVKSIKAFIQCGNDPKALDIAIEAVGLANNNDLAHQLIDHLINQSDGSPHYIFRLYSCLGQYKEAIKTIQAISMDEQVQESLTRIDEHELAARMLLRVCGGLTSFPFLNLNKSAYEIALIAMRAENRNSIDSKFKKRIESLLKLQVWSVCPVERECRCGTHVDGNCGLSLCCSQTVNIKYAEKYISEGLGCPFCRKELFEYQRVNVKEYIAERQKRLKPIENGSLVPYLPHKGSSSESFEMNLSIDSERRARVSFAQ